MKKTPPRFNQNAAAFQKNAAVFQAERRRVFMGLRRLMQKML
ncbi:MAG: hypothetical protein UHL07_07265 [Bacteroidaceae bacterium]|nr:hypothetical protein [Bacteroidaceae bacterium]